MRRTKIVCTIGPASESSEMLRKLIAAGLDVARLNFSHGTREQHARAIMAIREAEAAAGRPIVILLGAPAGTRGSTNLMKLHTIV